MFYLVRGVILLNQSPSDIFIEAAFLHGENGKNGENMTCSHYFPVQSDHTICNWHRSHIVDMYACEICGQHRLQKDMMLLSDIRDTVVIGSPSSTTRARVSVCSSTIQYISLSQTLP